MSVPKLSFHKSTARFYVWQDGKRFYLGRGDDPAKPYMEVVAGLMALFYADCQQVYRAADGTKTETLKVVKSVMREHMTEIAKRPLDEVDKSDLIAIRQSLILRGLVRKTIREYMRIIIQMFKWGAGLNLVDDAQYLRMYNLPALRQGEARSSKRFSRYHGNTFSGSCASFRSRGRLSSPGNF